MEKKEKKTWAESTPKEKRKGCTVLFVSAAVIIGFIWFIKTMENDQNSRNYNDLTSIAQFYADHVLPQNLKYPDDWSYERQQMNRLDSVTYKFTAVVLAKNGFGVRGRMIYNFKIQYVGTMQDSYSTDVNKKPDNWKILTTELVQ